MWWPGDIPAGSKCDELMPHIDCWSTLASMVGLSEACCWAVAQRIN